MASLRITNKVVFMYTVNSLSGGKTSSYMALHYEADYNVFSLVCIDDASCTPSDKKLVQRVNDKLEQSQGGKYGDFIATAEDDQVQEISQAWVILKPLSPADLADLRFAEDIFHCGEATGNPHIFDTPDEADGYRERHQLDGQIIQLPLNH